MKCTKGNIDLGYFWCTNFWVPDPPLLLCSITSLPPQPPLPTPPPTAKHIFNGSQCMPQQEQCMHAPTHSVRAPQWSLCIPQ